MQNNSARAQNRRFLEILGSSYKNYGYPQVYGWIEGILLISDHPLSQKGISRKITEVFGDNIRATSVPTINRALKVLEIYGVIHKSGSFKQGFLYSIDNASDVFSQMLRKFAEINKNTLHSLKNLKQKALNPKLREAIAFELTCAEKIQVMLSQCLENENDLEK